MADVEKVKAGEIKEEENDSGSETETEAVEKKGPVEKTKKKNAAAPVKIKPPAKKRGKIEQTEENKNDKDKDNKKKKAPVKAKEESEEEEEEEEEESDGEENGVSDKVPLLDQPLEVSGSRERKQVERFASKPEDRKTDDKKVEIPDGQGKPLKEISYIEFQLKKLNAENLKNLHRVLFGRIGQSSSIKKNILLFNGFDFDKDSSEYKKKLTILSKLKNPDLKLICGLLDISKTGKHSELAEKVMDFLLLPEDSGKEVPDFAKRPKRKGTTSKSYKEKDDENEKKKGKSKNSPKKKSKTSSDEEEPEDEEEEEGEGMEDGEDSEEDVKVKKEVKTEVDENDDGDEDDNDNDDDADAESEEESVKKGPKRPAKKKKVANSSSGKRGAQKSGNEGSNKKLKVIKPEDENENSSNNEDTDKKPPPKKGKNPPTDDEIKTCVKNVLEGANLEEITMKTVCKKVYEQYPDFDLGHKKEFIKNTVKSLISS